MSDLVEWAFRHHRDEIYHYLRRKAGHDRAEDLTQEVFADAVPTLSRFELGPELVLPFLYTIARRRLADDARRWARRGEPVSLEQLAVEPVSGDEYGPAVAKAIRVAMLKLRREQRELLVMKLLEGRSFAEIAQRRGLTIGACKMRTLRALRRLREELERQGLDP